MSVVLSDSVTDVIGAVEKLRADGQLVSSPERQLNEVEVLRDVVTMLEAEIVHRLREVDAVEAPKEVCGRATKAWLREELCLSGVEVSRYLRCVHQFRCYPLTEAAFDTAEITLSHALTIMPALPPLPQALRAPVDT